MKTKDPRPAKYSARWWKDEVTRAEKRLKDRWWDAADRVTARYLDRRDGDSSTATAEAYRYNIFWANVGILKASLYANPPKPMVSRQFSDHEDDVARVAGEVLERMVGLDLQKELSEEHQAFRHAVEDRLIAGAGNLWYRYEPTIEKKTTDPVLDPATGAELAPATEFEQVVDEQVEVDHVNFKDFLFPACRTWEEVTWCARRVHLTPERLKARFGAEKADLLTDPLDALGKPEGGDPDKAFKKGMAEVFEIWCKDTKKVYWLAAVGEEQLLDTRDDPLRLPGFFPCPKPLFATLTTNDMIPRPDYVMVEDQYRELDELSERCVLLEKALRVAGVYDQKNQAIQQLVNGALENTLIPVDSWGALAEAGGLKGVVDWMPIDVVAKVLKELTTQRMDKVQQIYELTGLSDIMRGATAPRETATAQNLKAQYSSVRLQYLQQEVAIFVQNGQRIKAGIICEHFQRETILNRSNMMNTPDRDLAQQAVELLKSGKGKDYRIEVNSDSLAIPDYNTERQGRLEFMTMFGQFISQVQPVLATLPQAAPFFLQLMQWCAAPFRGARQAEAILDKAVKALQMNPPGPAAEAEAAAAPPTDPNAVRVEEQKTATERQKGQNQMIGAQAQQVKDKSSQQTAMVKGVVQALTANAQPPQQPQNGSRRQ